MDATELAIVNEDVLTTLSKLTTSTVLNITSKDIDGVLPSTNNAAALDHKVQTINTVTSLLLKEKFGDEL